MSGAGQAAVAQRIDAGSDDHNLIVITTLYPEGATFSIGGRHEYKAWLENRAVATRSAVRQGRQINDGLAALSRGLAHAQGQALQAEKMAAIGVLAAGVAHEINNPLGFVASNLGTLDDYVGDLLAMLNAYTQIEALLRQCAPVLGPESVALAARLQALQERIDLPFLRQDVRSLLSESHEGLGRVKKIVQRLSDFAHGGGAEPWVLADIHAGIDSAVHLLGAEFPGQGQLRKEFGQLPLVECLPLQLHQVFINLLSNAAQAIAEHGVIAIRSGVRGDAVWIEVMDSGQGIPGAQLPRIFDPFFTTRPVGQGLGLGLAIAYRIVHQHRGRIEVDSEVGQGSTFRVWLPLTQSHVADGVGLAAHPA